MPISLQAEEVNYISYDINTSVVSKIDKFFTEKPQKTNVIWTPKINGRSRYAFSIPKDAFLISKKHSDSSELYYLSEIIDNGLTFHQKKAANLNIFSHVKLLRDERDLLGDLSKAFHRLADEPKCLFDLTVLVFFLQFHLIDSHKIALRSHIGEPVERSLQFVREILSLLRLLGRIDAQRSLQSDTC